MQIRLIEKNIYSINQIGHYPNKIKFEEEVTQAAKDGFEIICVDGNYVYMQKS